MKFGVAEYGLFVWYGGYYDYRTRLADLKALGYDGIERLECADAADAVYKAAECRRLGMDFATVRGPNVEISNLITGAMGKEYVWNSPLGIGRDVPMDVYIRRSNEFAKGAQAWGVKTVLHNHLGQRIENQEELDIFMKECPEVGLLLDIGHLHGANGDVLGTIEKYFDRIVAVHFKDIFIKDASIGLDKWTERLRFCELGAGNANEPWEEAGKLLKNLGYDGWVFVEHDTHLQDPMIDLKVSIDHLKRIFL